MISSFAVLALALAGVGLAGLVSDSVAARHREFGIRLALGATPARVGSKILLESSLLIAAALRSE
jgi:putative ABC transport system permease protein